MEDRDLPQAAGRYKLLGKIGAGSTSEVYRALDPRLGRDVAIKLLPAWLARDEAALRRFGCEARLTAALNHPHIVVVYDMVELDGRPGLVLELLAGRTLRQRLADGPVPVAEAIAHGLAILDGLDAAHRARVIHRDLKPDNIFLTRDGGLKLFDFGIARPRDAGDPAETSDESSDAGDPRVPGTAAYMAPEQLRGARGDERADLFAFGCVLVEMVSQRGPFDRPTHEDRLRAVLEEAPAPLQAAGRPVSACLQRFVQRCLAKDPEDRFQSARDAAFALAEVRRRVPPASPSAGPVPQPPRAPRAISRDSR